MSLCIILNMMVLNSLNSLEQVDQAHARQVEEFKRILKFLAIPEQSAAEETIVLKVPSSPQFWKFTSLEIPLSAKTSAKC